MMGTTMGTIRFAIHGDPDRYRTAIGNARTRSKIAKGLAIPVTMVVTMRCQNKSGSFWSFWKLDSLEKDEDTCGINSFAWTIKMGRLPHPGQGILGPAPAIYVSQHTTLPSAFSIMPPQDPTWHTDTSVSSHLNFNASNLSTIFDKRLFSSVHVGDGKSILVTNTGHSIIPSHHRPLHLHNVLVTSNIIKNLISVRQFTRDNNCTIEFDAFGFSVKDYLTRHILLRCDSSGDLYPVTKPSTLLIAFLSTSASTWHQCLGHPGDQIYPLRSKSDMGQVAEPLAGLVIQGFRQKEMIDYFDTYAPVARITTIDNFEFGTYQNQSDNTKRFLSSKFSMKDMGEADIILGIKIKRENKGIVITQSHYIEKILKKFNREDCSSVSTPMDPVEKLKPNTSKHVDQLEYSRAISFLMYAMTSTRLDITYAVSRSSRFTSNPSRQHCQAIIRVFKYLKGTMNYGLSYASKKQTCIIDSTMKSEFVAFAAAGKKAEWLRNLVHEILIWPNPIAPISIRCDSVATLAKAYSQIYNADLDT
ncbi:zinc finger, CCHC-type containing protein [Tanacetum coccineum]